MNIIPQDIKKNKGVVIFNPIERKVIKKILAPNDKNETYLGHFLNAVKDNDGNYLNEGIGAWY